MVQSEQALGIGSRIFEFRRSRDVTQADLAARIGLSHGALVNYEKEKRDPPASALASICEIYGLNPDWLLLGNGAMERQDIHAHLDTALKATKIFLEKYRKDADGDVELRLVKALFRYLVTHGTIEDDMRDTLFEAIAVNE